MDSFNAPGNQPSRSGPPPPAAANAIPPLITERTIHPTKTVERDWPDRASWILPAGSMIVAGFDVVARSGSVGLAWVILIGALTAITIRVAWDRHRPRAWPMVGAVVAATPLALRQSPVVTVLSFVAVATLLVFAAADGFERSSRLSSVMARSIAGLASGPIWLLGPAMRLVGRDRGATLLRSATVAAVVGGSLALALAAADPVFAALLSAVGPAPILNRTVSLTLWLFPIAGLLLLAASAKNTAVGPPVPGPTGALQSEGLVGMAAIATILGAWCSVQIAVSVGGADHVLETADLTRADYARSGFFQLVVTAALILGLLWTLEVMTMPSTRDRWFAMIAAIVTIEALALVVVTGLRLSLYTDAFGLTVTRVVVAWFLGWLALVITRVGLSITVHRFTWRSGSAPISARFVVWTASMTIVAFGWWNPEARIVAVNLDRSTSEAAADVGYLTTLSSDALVELDLHDERTQLAICRTDTDAPWWNPNRSRSRLASVQALLTCDR